MQTAVAGPTTARRHARPSRSGSSSSTVASALPLWRIARESGRSLATVARHMKRLGLARLAALQPPKPVRCYERSAPGELLHLDTKRLGRIRGVGHRITGERQHRNRGIGWDAVHLAIDDHSRVSFARILPDEKALCCIQFLREAVAWYASLGVRIDRVMTDNGSGYFSKAFRVVCHELNIRHSAPGPTRPRPMGRSNASCRPAFASGPTRSHTKAPRNAKQPYSPLLTATTSCGLKHQPPISRIPGVNKLLRLNT